MIAPAIEKMPSASTASATTIVFMALEANGTGKESARMLATTECIGSLRPIHRRALAWHFTRGNRTGMI